MRYSFSSKAVGKAAVQFILCSISCMNQKLDVLELVQLTCTLYCVTTIKLIKDRKLLLLFPQFIKCRTIELLWNLDITCLYPGNLFHQCMAFIIRVIRIVQNE